MRALFQVLVFPFRTTPTGVEYAVFRREDEGWWQGVAGGGEGEESPSEAAARELREETGLDEARAFYRLDTTTSIPKIFFKGHANWDPDIYVIPEYAFAADASGADLVLSDEHTAVEWLSYDEAFARLKWDSNRTALWELSTRLRNGALTGAC